MRHFRRDFNRHRPFRSISDAIIASFVLGDYMALSSLVVCWDEGWDWANRLYCRRVSRECCCCCRSYRFISSSLLHVDSCLISLNLTLSHTPSTAPQTIHSLSLHYTSLSLNYTLYQILSSLFSSNTSPKQQQTLIYHGNFWYN